MANFVSVMEQCPEDDDLYIVKLKSGQLRIASYVCNERMDAWIDKDGNYIPFDQVESWLG